MRTKVVTQDLGDDVLYAVGRSATLTLLVLNTRPVSGLNREQEDAEVGSADLRHGGD